MYHGYVLNFQSHREWCNIEKL